MTMNKRGRTDTLPEQFARMESAARRLAACSSGATVDRDLLVLLNGLREAGEHEQGLLDVIRQMALTLKKAAEASEGHADLAAKIKALKRRMALLLGDDDDPFDSVVH
jgi:hypothetical protein